MKRFDMHIHTSGGPASPEALLSNMAGAGVFGGALISAQPEESHCDGIGALPFERRLENILSWTKDYSDRLFPILWIHPDEPNLLQKIDTACKSGIAGFKILCDSFYPYDERVKGALCCIAEENKPVIFHSGILWNGGDSSKYNRPLHFESLIGIPGLRFSMGHCSWPWIDECIALYGKFLNTFASKADGAEMFFDLTPGTPPIYRQELITKLMTVGYDVPHNILFGTDSDAELYRKNWVEEWLCRDDAIYDQLDVPDKVRGWIYQENLMRFLGRTEKEFQHVCPVPDGSGGNWSLAREQQDS